MVPSDWEALYWNTLNQVKSGVISEARLDDAVTRILSVKKYLGLFDNRKPHSFKENHLGSNNHRNLARQAVRESLVLLKNNTNVLPMNPKKNYLIIGDQSKHIENQMGGWTITWQGKSWEGVSISNDDFPKTQRIYSSLSDRSCISDIELPPPPPMLGEQMSASSCRSVHAEILESVSKIKCSLLGRKGGLLHHYGNSYGSEGALNTLLGGHGG